MNIADTLVFLRPNAQWTLIRNEYDTLEWIGPGAKPTLAELQVAWDQLQTRKIWANTQAFITEFTLPEMAAISLSTDPTIAALRLLLASWDGEVWSDDPRVIAGLDALETAGIINLSRRNSVLNINV